MIDLHRAGFVDHLRQEPYRSLAKEAAMTADLSGLGLDFVAFCGRPFLRRDRPRRGLAVDIPLFEDTRISEAELARLLKLPAS